MNTGPGEGGGGKRLIGKQDPLLLTLPERFQALAAWAGASGRLYVCRMPVLR